MTNEKKAIEIAREHHAYCFSDAVSGAIEMADWKDKQFNDLKTYIISCIEDVRQMLYDHKNASGFEMSIPHTFAEARVKLNDIIDYIKVSNN